jgi:hypothetical protein
MRTRVAALFFANAKLDRMMIVCTQPLVGPAEAARRLGLTPERVRQLAANVLRAIPVDAGRLVYRAKDVERLARERASRRADR